MPAAQLQKLKTVGNDTRAQHLQIASESFVFFCFPFDMLAVGFMAVSEQGSVMTWSNKTTEKNWKTIVVH